MPEELCSTCGHMALSHLELTGACQVHGPGSCSCDRFSAAPQAQAQPARETWEFSTTEYYSYPSDDEMNIRGAAGWDLAGIIEGQSANRNTLEPVRFIWKRRIT